MLPLTPPGHLNTSDSEEIHHVIQRDALVFFLQEKVTCPMESSLGMRVEQLFYKDPRETVWLEISIKSVTD